MMKYPPCLPSKPRNVKAAPISPVFVKRIPAVFCTMKAPIPPAMPHLLLLPPSRAAPDAKTSLAYTTGPFSAPHCPARPSRTTEGLILYGAVGAAVT